MHVNTQTSFVSDGSGQRAMVYWQVYIQGISIDTPAGHDTMCTLYISCESKEDACRLFKELAQQIVDSGEVPTLNNKLLDDLLKAK